MYIDKWRDVLRWWLHEEGKNLLVSEGQGHLWCQLASRGLHGRDDCRMLCQQSLPAFDCLGNHASCDQCLLIGPCLRVLQSHPLQGTIWQDGTAGAKDAALWRIGAAGPPGAAPQLPPVAGQCRDK